MKIRRSVFWPVAFMAGLAVLVLLFTITKRLERKSMASVETNALPSANIGPLGAQASAPANTTAPTVQISGGEEGALQLPLGSKTERAIGLLSTYNDVPIDFYGKLEDQFGNPVAGAQIKGSIMVNNGTKESTDWIFATSDNNGIFQFHGKGESVGMMPHKEGYALRSNATLFKYSHLEEHPYVSDANSPAIIKMWKLQGAEPLVSINQHYKLVFIRDPINFDLLAGKIVPTGGDVKITVNRAPGIISGRSRLDWGVKIEAVDGGLMDSDGQERVTYAAPGNGYQPSMTFVFSTNAPNKWFGGFNQGFFLASRNSQVYSKLGLSFDINDAPNGYMSITFSGVASTNGSRNWEGDSNTMQAQ